MSECEHQWDMANIQFGFVVFEKCFHCNCMRTYFTGKGWRFLETNIVKAIISGIEWKTPSHSASIYAVRLAARWSRLTT